MTHAHHDDHTAAVSQYLEMKDDADTNMLALNITKEQMMKQTNNDITNWANKNCDTMVMHLIACEPNKTKKVDILMDDIKKQKQCLLTKLHSKRKEMIDKGVSGDYLPFTYDNFTTANGGYIDINEHSDTNDDDDGNEFECKVSRVVSYDSQEQHQCCNCDDYFDNVFYCTECKEDNTKLRCLECCQFLHRNNKRCHTFDLKKSYVKSGKSGVLETEKNPKNEETYNVTLTQRLTNDADDTKEEKELESNSQQQYQCETCKRNFDDVFYCTKCKDDGMELNCVQCGQYLHGIREKDHVFDVKQSYIKSGRKFLFETKKVQLIKQTYHVKLSKALQKWLKNGATEECLKSIKKDLLQLDPSKVVPVVGLQAVGIITVEVAREATSGVAAAATGIRMAANVSTMSVLPGLSYAGLFVVKICYAGWQVFQGDITMKEFWLKTGKNVLKCGAGFGGSIGGFMAGTLIGTTLGPIGAIVGGILGAVAGGLLSYNAAKAGTNVLWDWLTKKFPRLNDSETVK